MVNKLINNYKNFSPGILVAVLIAVASKFLSNNYEVPAMLMAILIGMSLNFLSEDKKCEKGINFSSKNILYLGIILLGSRITFENILSININITFLIILAVILTILFSIFFLRLFGFQYRFGILIGGAIAICGASAALAISSVLPKDERSNERLTFVILGVTIISLKNIAVGSIWDPVAVSLCCAAGEKANLDIRFGGKVSSSGGSPINKKVLVKKITAGVFPVPPVVMFPTLITFVGNFFEIKNPME